MAAPTLTMRRAVPATRRYFSELWRRREFAWYLATSNLKARNASTSLGLAWWVLNPLLLAGIYWVVFGVIFAGTRGDDYIAYLLSGIFVFYYTRSAMVGGVSSILTNKKLLANLNFPRLVLPSASLIEATVGFGAALAVFYPLVGPVTGIWPTSQLVWLLPILIIHAVFNFGLAAITARIAVPFRDVNNLVPYVLRLWLYLSPIIYPVDRLEAVPAALRDLLRFNPMFPIIGVYRSALLDYPLDMADVWASALWAIGIALVGVGMFVKNEGRMARYL